MATLPPPPPISSTERYVAGHRLHVYGLDELSTTAQHVTVLWLHHGRGFTSASMADFALRCVGAYHGHARSSERGLLAITFDQRNHGTRELNPQANESWNTGNPAHAQDMFALIAGAVVDNSLLIDLLQASLFPEKPLGFIDSHYVLGVSLGGHSTWQLMFADERVTTGVSIIGCPDYMFLLSDRAKASKLSTYDTANDGAGFLGSKDFPPDLVRACRKYDPKGLVFGTQAVTWPLPPDRDGQTKQKLASRLRGKKFLNCSGGADKLVPYRISEPFVGFLKNACEQWAVDLGVQFDDRIYPGAGHEFSPEMVKDAVKFIIDAVATEQGSGGSAEAAKI